ncbi:hypothetical protein ABPG74_022082 [Tetrahymena malaccensis]
MSQQFMEEEELNELYESQESKDKQVTEIQQNQNQLVQKKKRIVKKRAKWIPFLIQNVFNPDEQPIYVFYFRKCMKSYASYEYNKYRTYGFEEAGIGRIEQLKIDKSYGNVEIYLDTFHMGETSFKYLIDLYKSYQDQQYYQLALSLEKYQEWTQNQQIHLNKMFNKLRKTKYMQSHIEQHLDNFESDVTNWISNQFQNDIYEASFGFCNVEKKLLVLKKKIFSKNLIMFLGGDPNKSFYQMQKQNMKENTNYLFGGEEFDGKIQLEKMIKLLNQQLNGEQKCVVQDQVITIEGVILPTTKTITTYFYDEVKRQVIQSPTLFYLVVTQYNFEANWIKYLMDLRNSMNQGSSYTLDQSQMSSQTNSQQSDNVIKNFEFMCQQEYFLEKFNYI